jgi:hypothetical protein
MIMIGAGLALANCTPMNNPPLFFAQRQTFGAGLHGSVPEQTTSLVVGYKDRDVAIVPVSAVEHGRIVPICALEGAKRDSFSVFGNFKGDTKVSTTTAGLELDSFFATGIAADHLAAAFNPTPADPPTPADAKKVDPVTRTGGLTARTRVPVAGSVVAKRPECRFPPAVNGPA